MGSSKDTDKKLKKAKKEAEKAELKAAKKEKKRSETDGISKDKKDKKKERADKEKIARALEKQLQDDAMRAQIGEKPENDEKEVTKTATGVGGMVPFAMPLADDKLVKKIYKLVKKGTKLKALHRGVKETEKAVKKAPLKGLNTSSTDDVPGLVVIAGDISPLDVISHIPVLCEDHGVPYIYVRSRADLGVAASTKRSCSVVMLKPEGKKSNKTEEDKKDEDAAMDGTGDAEKKVDPAEYLQSWKETVKVVQKQWTAQVEPWVKGVHPRQIAAGTKAR